jgi:hypothetical protein
VRKANLRVVEIRAPRQHLLGALAGEWIVEIRREPSLEFRCRNLREARVTAVSNRLNPCHAARRGDEVTVSVGWAEEGIK